MKSEEVVYVPVPIEEGMTGGFVPATLHFHDDRSETLSIKENCFVFTKDDLVYFISDMLYIIDGMILKPESILEEINNYEFPTIR